MTNVQHSWPRVNSCICFIFMLENESFASELTLFEFLSSACFLLTHLKYDEIIKATLSEIKGEDNDESDFYQQSIDF